MIALSGSVASAATSTGPRIARAAAIAPVTTGSPGASSGWAVQRSPLPRIQVASGSSRSSSSVSPGQAPNSA